MILEGCPGAARLKTPTWEEKICPVCGNLIEIFSIDTEVACEHCGFIAYNDALSCAQWCQYAEKCLGLVSKDTGPEQRPEKARRGKNIGF